METPEVARNAESPLAPSTPTQPVQGLGTSDFGLTPTATRKTQRKYSEERAKYRSSGADGRYWSEPRAPKRRPKPSSVVLAAQREFSPSVSTVHDEDMDDSSDGDLPAPLLFEDPMDIDPQEDQELLAQMKDLPIFRDLSKGLQDRILAAPECWTLIVDLIWEVEAVVRKQQLEELRSEQGTILLSDLDLELQVLRSKESPLCVFKEDVLANDFDVLNLLEATAAAAPLLFSILRRAAGPKKDLSALIALGILVRSGSQRVNGLQFMFGFYLYGLGASRRVFNLLCELGVTVSETRIDQVLDRRTEKYWELLEAELLDDDVLMAQHDNVNFRQRQRFAGSSRTANVQSMTMRLLFVAKFHDRLLSREPIPGAVQRLSFNDIVANKHVYELIDIEQWQYWAARVLVESEEQLGHLKEHIPSDAEQVDALRPLMREAGVVPTSDLHPAYNGPTRVHTLPLLNVNEGLKSGTIQVMREWLAVAERLKDVCEWSDINGGDVGSCKNMHSAQRLRPSGDFDRFIVNPSELHKNFLNLQLLYDIGWDGECGIGAMVEITGEGKNIKREAKHFYRNEAFFLTYLKMLLVSAYRTFSASRLFSPAGDSWASFKEHLRLFRCEFIGEPDPDPVAFGGSLACDQQRCHFVQLLVLGHRFVDARSAIRHGEDDRLIAHWRLDLPIYLALDRTNYAREALQLLVGLGGRWSPWHASIVRHNRTLDTGRPGHSKANDQGMENEIGFFKGCLASGLSRSSAELTKLYRTASNLDFLRRIRDAVASQLALVRGSAQSFPQPTRRAALILAEFERKQVWLDRGDRALLVPSRFSRLQRRGLDSALYFVERYLRVFNGLAPYPEEEEDDSVDDVEQGIVFDDEEEQ